MSIQSFPNTLTLIPSLSITASQRLPTSRKSQAVKSTKTSNKTFRTTKKRSKSPKQNNARKPSKEELELIEEPSPSTWTTLPLRDDAQSLLGNALKPTKPLTHKDFFTEEDASDSDEDFEFAANDYPEFYGEPSYKSEFYEEPSNKNEFYEEPSKENGFYEEPSKEKGFNEKTRKKTDLYEETRSAKPSTSKYSLKFDEYDDEDITVSEKGVPAVMRCFDKTKIFIKAGDGGNGVVAFRREKFVPMGGPSGGNGGKGGSIYLEVDDSVNSLLGFRKGIHFRAGNGKNGQGRNMDGAKGEDVVIKVAPGTIVRDPNDGSVLLELTKPGQKVMVLPGGRGGRGNASFKCEKNKAPKIAENGEEGIEMWLDLELKLVADVGIIGIPNAGKSTFLSTISAAKPSIADYPFTTLLPNLGVVSLDYNATMVVADLPGLLEGAHRGYGLGHEFLRHTERCHVLIHIVDGTSSQPDYEFEAVRLELDLFNPELAHKPFVVAFNKMDIPEAANRWKSFEKYMVEHNITGFCMSAATKSGTKEVISTAYELLKKNAALQDKTPATVYKHDGIQEMLSHKKNARLDEFEIDFENETRTWSVQGAALERFIQMTNWEYIDSYKRFQSILEACGVDRALKQRGVKEGDTVTVGQMELEWHDATDFSNVIDNRRYSRGSTKWR